jgi:hypothetical protein
MLAGTAEGLAEVAFAAGDRAGTADLLSIAAGLRGRSDRGSPVVRRPLEMVDLAPTLTAEQALAALSALAQPRNRDDEEAHVEVGGSSPPRPRRRSRPKSKKS